MNTQENDKINNQESDKSFFLSDWAIDNKMVVYVIIALLLAGGIYAFYSMPRENFPEVVENKVYISSVYPGNPPTDIEKFIITPIEDEIKDISGIIDVQSVAYNDYGMTIIEFNDDISIEEAKIEVKDKVDLVKAEADWPTLDTGAKVEPTIFDLNIAEEVPILNINITGNYKLQQIKEYAELLQDDIEDLQEIKEAPIRGINDREIEIALDSYKMTAAQVSFNDISQAIQGNNKTITGGSVINNEQRLNVRVVGEITNPQQLGNIAVKQDGGTVYLRDLAEIHFVEKDKTTYARSFGDPVIMIDVKKRSGENMIEAAEKIRTIIKDAQLSYLPSDLNIEIANDQAPKTENQVSDLINNIIFGIILVVGVLMFFLGIKNASFVGIAIPLSMLMSIMILSFTGTTLNTMVLFGLVMGLGMLVDNGIVVVENVYSLMNQGYSRMEAAKQGVGEIAWPIIASTATTLAAFFPLGLWPGTIGKFMVIFPITLSIVLFSSLFVALVINSMLTSEFITTEEDDKTATPFKVILRRIIIFGVLGAILLIAGYIWNVEALRILGNLSIVIAIFIFLYDKFLYPASTWLQDKGLPWLEGYYQKFLTWSLKGKTPIFLLVGMFVLLILSFALVGLAQPKVLFFPENDPNQIMVYIEYPEGTDIEKTNRLSKEVEQQVIDVFKKYEVTENGEPYNYMAESIISQTGEGAGNPQVDAGSSAEIPHKAKVTVSLREFKFRRGVNSVDVMEEVRHAVQGHPGVSITVEKDANGPPVGFPINIEVTGKDYEEMMVASQEMMDYINTSGIAGIEELRLDVSKNIPELQLELNKDVASSLGVTNQMIGGTLRQAVYGVEVSRYRPKGDDDDYPINIRLNENQRYDESVLLNQPVTFTNTKNGMIMQVPISTVTTQSRERQFTQIRHEDYKKTITIYSNVLQDYNANEVVNDVKKFLKESDYQLPDGMDYKFTGEQEKQAENLNFLLFALLLGLTGIVLIIVLQFNSISKPIIILMSIILSFIGVFLGLVFNGDDFVILMTMMGIISLAGIVVNNAIVLIDYTDLLLSRRRKKLNIKEGTMLPIESSRKAIVNGGKSRLRPVLLTAITTVLGLIPLAIGLNIDFYGLFANYDPAIYVGGDNVKFWGPLAWTVIYGLMFATFLTLVMVPVMQFLVNKMKFRFRYGKDAKKYPHPELLKEG